MINKLKKVGTVALSALMLASVDLISGVSPVARAAECTAASDFLGLPPWYRGLECEGDAIKMEGEEIGVIILTVALNVLDMALRLLSMVAVIFIIIGGFQYMLSRGDPGAAAKGKQTITRAIVGLIIGIVSSAAVGFIVGGLGK